MALHNVQSVGREVFASDKPRRVFATTTRLSFGFQAANAKALAETLLAGGLKLVSGGTDNHLMLVDVFSKGITGKVAEAALGKAGITVNKNAIPFDQNPPMVASGIRVGTPAVTTRGMREAEMEQIADLIARVLAAPDDEAKLAAVKSDVERLCRNFPLYPDLPR